MADRIDTSQWLRLGALFDQAISLDAAQQAELLQTIETEDAELGQALASLLEADARHHARTSEHRERVLQGSLDAIQAPGVAVGDRVGPYVLRENLGQGGMGVVFRAERADGRVQQEVALKIVKRALLDASGRERFLREREIVAAFQHPSIARMLDVGETPDGSPYLAMELIRGLPITDYCNAHKLDTRARVEVFVRVCEAVQHAHANLVLHRDLKPSNVLVGGDALPKLIDFGIAKPLTMVADEEHQQTATAHRFFSPSNVAPEQLRGERVGVACDVYQLGTLLHELLCGATVFDATGLTAGQLEQRILEVAPEAPSARAARAREETAQARGTASAVALARELRGDLDAIVALALRKLPADRYSSVEQLAGDLRRYLAGLPVVAQRGQRWYRARKFLRRHALAVGVSTAALALVAAFVTALWLQSQRIAHERNLAQQRAKEVEQVANFEADMLQQVDPIQAGRELMDDMQAKFAAALVKAGLPEDERAGQVAMFAGLLQHVNATDTAVDLIDRTNMKPAVAAIEQQFKNQPLVAARLQQVLADRYVQMGLYEAAMPLQKSALATRRRVLGDKDRDTLQSIESMGELLRFQQRWSEAEGFLREALAKRRRVLGEETPETVQSRAVLGELLLVQNKVGEAEPYLHQALASSRRVNGEGSSETIELLGYMGILMVNKGKLGEAERYLREAVQKNRGFKGEERLRKFEFILNMGWVLWQQGKMDEAEPYLRESLEIGRRLQGDENPETVYKVNIMGTFLMAQGKYRQAEPYFRETLEKSRRIWGEQQPFTLLTMTRLGRNLEAQGRLGEAEPYLRAALDTSRRALGDKDPTTLFALVAMGDLLLDQGKLSQAERYLREASEKIRPAGSADRMTIYANSQLGALLVAQGKYADAEELLAPHEAAARAALSGGDSDLIAPSLMQLGMARTGLAQFAAAESDLLAAQPILVKTDGAKGRNTRKCTQALIDLYTAWNAAQPGKGHDTAAIEWKQRLDVLDATASAAGKH